MKTSSLYKGFLLSGWMLLSVFLLKAQTGNGDFRFEKPGQRSVSMSFRFINNLTIIPLFINNSDTLHFILDTGLNTAILTELSLSDSLSLSYTRQVRLNGLGQGDPIDALHSSGNEFRTGGLVGSNQNLYVLLQNIFNLSSLLGTRVHGLLGYDLFRNFVIEVNFTRKVIQFHDPVSYRYKKSRKAITLPMEMQNTKPFIEAAIEQEDGSRVPVKLLVDLGASHALWLDPKTDENISIPQKTIDTYLGTGLNGQIHGSIGKMNKVIIGPYVLEDVITAFPDSISTGLATRFSDRNGSIGSDILRRFDVVIDYPNGSLTLTPNPDFRKDFKMNMSGMEIEASIPGLPYYQITFIRKNSPADRAGLRRGDEILSVNDRSAINLNINSIYDIFESQPGRKIKITVRRNGEKFRTIFYLEDRL